MVGREGEEEEEGEEKEDGRERRRKMAGMEGGGWEEGEENGEEGTGDHWKYKLTHFLLCFFWWSGNSWFGGLREESSSLFFRVHKQTSTRRRAGFPLRGSRWRVWGGRRGEGGEGKMVQS